MAQPESKQGHRGFGVAASPLNAVKLELVLVLLGGLVLLAIHGRLGLSPAGEALILGGYGLAGAGWLVWRARRALGAARRTDARH